MVDAWLIVLCVIVPFLLTFLNFIFIAHYIHKDETGGSKLPKLVTVCFLLFFLFSFLLPFLFCFSLLWSLSSFIRSLLCLILEHNIYFCCFCFFFLLFSSVSSVSSAFLQLTRASCYLPLCVLQLLGLLFAECTILLLPLDAVSQLLRSLQPRLFSKQGLLSWSS